MTKYFYLSESPGRPGRYTIRINFDNMPPMHTKGSYNLLMARLLGLSYCDFLRYCRDECGATIVGRTNQYPIPFFDKDKKSEALVKELNFRITQVLSEIGEK